MASSTKNHNHSSTSKAAPAAKVKGGAKAPPVDADGTDAEIDQILTDVGRRAPGSDEGLSAAHRATDPGAEVIGPMGDPYEAEVRFTSIDLTTGTELLRLIKGRAMALPAAEVMFYRVPPAIALVNVRIMTKALSPFRSQIAAKLPDIDLANFDGLEKTATALVVAASDVDGWTFESELQKNIDRARVLRGRTLPVLFGLACTGYVPMKVYRAIEAGRGVRDTALDCIAIPKVFTKYGPAIAGKHSVSDADLAESAALGTWLIQNLNTKGGNTIKAAPVEAIDLRNRVATLLARDYTDAEIVAHYFLRDAWQDSVPPLRSRQVTRRAATPTGPTTPGTTPTGPVTTPPSPPAPGTVATVGTAPPATTVASPGAATPTAGAGAPTTGAAAPAPGVVTTTAAPVGAKSGA